MQHHTRRVVTGHDSEGRSVFTADSAIEAFEAGPGTFGTRLWATTEFPSDNVDPRDGAELIETLTSPDGTGFYIVQFAPHSESPLHRTQSVDYGFIVSGVIQAVLDSGEVAELHPGDSIIQRGTSHIWRNLTDEWARAVFTVVGSKPVVVGGRTLEPDM